MSPNVASSWNSRLQHSGVSASLGISVIIYVSFDVIIFRFDNNIVDFIVDVITYCIDDVMIDVLYLILHCLKFKLLILKLF